MTMIHIDTAYRTALPVRENPPFRLDTGQGVLLLGSCFTDNIGERLAASGVQAWVNPGGVQYNPASIAALLRAAMRGALPAGSVFTHEGRTRCWLFPTRFSSADASVASGLFADTLATLREALLEASALIVTFGTAWVYEHRLTATSSFEGVVGNCHKVPAAEFHRRRLGVEEIAAGWKGLVAEARRYRSAHGVEDPLRLIFTVSPIRHFKDGAHENTLSKGTLHLAVASLVESVADSDYFPAYELLCDDLRDYRFYAEDMVHPSSVAVDYIWEHFQAVYYTEADRALMSARVRALRAAAHRPMLQ